MADYNVTARFEADASAYIAAVREAQSATDRLATSVEKASQQISKAFDGTDQSVTKTGQAAEKASKQTGSLGDTASKAGKEAQSAFDGVTDGIDAAGISLDGTAGAYSSLGDTAAQAGTQATSAFDGVTNGIEAAGISLDGTAGNYSSLGEAAQQSGAKAKGAFEGATAGIQAANISLDGAAGKYTNLGNTASVSMQKAAQGIRNNASDLKTMGSSIAVVGGAWAAFNTTMAATGIQYNTLQQVSSKAMETMTGSAEAAADQMERFHAFADESPFSRATFLEAQQQLMAFGIEAERVVPSLEGIQNAVAAIGGGNAEIMQLTDILGSIQGQGQITGRELQRMGQMGIDAADIIGEQMGKSGAAIREEITAGTLDADTAIEALTTGMAERFDGAAAGLKETFEGAIDRVKAAFRDLSGDMFEWAVGSEGGGFLTDALNGVADFIRVIEQLPGPVKNVLGILSTLGSTATVAAGGFLLLAPQAMQAWEAFQKIRQVAPAGITLRGVGRAALTASVGVTALYLAAEMLPDAFRNTGDMEQFETALKLAGDAATSTSANFDELFDGALSHFSPMTGHIDGMTAALHHSSNAWDSYLDPGERAAAILPGMESQLKLATTGLENMDQAMSSLVQGGNFDAAVAGFQKAVDKGADLGMTVEEVAQSFPAYMDALQALGAEHGHALEGSELYAAALGNLPPALENVVHAAENAAEQDQLTNALEEVGVAADGTVDSLSNYLDMLFQTGLAATSERDAHRRYQETLEGIGEAIDEITDPESGLGGLSEVLNETGTDFNELTDAGRLAGDAFDEIAIAGRASADAMAENGASQEEVQAALQGTYEDLIAAANEFDITGTAADELARHVMGIPDEMNIETWMDEVAKETALDLGTHLDSIPSELFVLANMSPDALEQAFATGEAIDLIDDHKLVDVVVDDQGTPGQVQTRVNQITGKTEYVLVDDNGTTTDVQQRIVEINGVERTVWVDDNGTIYNTQAAIDGVRDGNSFIYVSDNAGDSSGNIDNAARDRYSTIRVSYVISGGPSPGGRGGVPYAPGKGPGGYAGGVVGRDFGLATGGIAGSTGLPALAAGGVAGGIETAGLPKLATGGRLPYTGLGQDMILGVSSQGMPTALVDDGEWVINEPSSTRYHQLLGLVNQDDPKVHHLAGLNNGGQAGRARLASQSGGGMSPNVNVAAPDLSGIGDQVASAINGMPIQVTVNADGQAILRVVAQAQHSATRGRPAAPLMKQG